MFIVSLSDHPVIVADTIVYETYVTKSKGSSVIAFRDEASVPDSLGASHQ